ncbi:hypothetical protein TNCV_1764491 [Trichonephila clavipes]|nr:hypothetical protein TNCV_1764491 [Trichonephila clavipes]
MGTLLGNGWCTRRRRAFSWQLDLWYLWDWRVARHDSTVMHITSGSLPSLGIVAMAIRWAWLALVMALVACANRRDSTQKTCCFNSRIDLAWVARFYI